MKTPKFLICNDPTVDDSSEYLLHSHKPRFLAVVDPIAFDDIEKRPDGVFADALYVNSEGVMDIYRLQMVENIDQADEEDCLDELFVATDYFVNYLQAMEKEEGNTNGYPVKDYSAELPGLKILHAPNTWTVVYNGLVAEFKTEEEMDEFLETDLNIEPELLDQGVVNEFD